jgi:hypothetical protein
MKKIFLLFNLFCGLAFAQIGSGLQFSPPSWFRYGNTVATNTAYIGTNDNRVLNVVTNGTLTGMWDSIGRFGIGPGRPQYDFDNRKSKPGTFVRTNTANTFSTGYALNYVTADVASGGIIAFGSGGGVGSLYMNNAVYTAGSSTAAMGIVNQVVGPLIFANGGFATSNEAFRVDVNKNIMIEGAGPTHPLNSGTCTAILHIGAGATKYPPIRLTSTALQTGTNIIAGAIEFLTDDYYVTITTGTAVQKLARCLTGSATLNFASTAAGTSSDLTITVTGASDGDPVNVGVPNASTLANGVFTAWVSAANTVTVRFTNTELINPLDPASGIFKVTVNKN